MRSHGHAAFARADVEDARRGHPASDLTEYANRHQLAQHGQALLAAFRPAQPAWPEYTFNVLSGQLAPGELGLVEHELEQVNAEGDGLGMTGGFHDVRYIGRRQSLLSLLLPFGEILRKVPNEPFAAPAVWVPATRVVIRAPETALLPRLVARSAERFPLAGNPKLADEGLPELRLAGGNDIDPQLRLEVFGASAAALGSLDATYVAVTVGDGLVSVQRNGFVADEAAIDALVEAALTVAAAARAAGLARCAPQPLDTPLPPPPELDLRGMLKDPHRRPMPEQADAFARAAGELGLVNEDPVALHRAVPALAVPGVAVGCLLGRAHGWAAPGRLAWFTQRGFPAGALRGVAVFAARPGAATPVGGIAVDGTDLQAEVCDGVALCWRRTPAIGRLESRPLLAEAAEAMRRLELAAV